MAQPDQEQSQPHQEQDPEAGRLHQEAQPQQPPQPEQFPYQTAPVYAAPPEGAPAPIPLFRPALLGRADLLAVVRDALIPLLVVLLLVFGVVVGLAWLISSTGHGGFQDWFTSTVVLVAGALGAPTGLTFSGGAVNGSAPGQGVFGFNVSLQLSISLTAWTVTFLLFFLWMRRARRSEAASPSASPLQLAARSALPALGVSVVMLVLALVSTTSDVFNLVGPLIGDNSGLTVPGGTDPFGNGGTDPFGNFGNSGGGSGAALTLGAAGGAADGPHSSIGVSPGWVFLGPLLIAFAAFLIGRLTTVARRPVGDPGGEWIRKLIAPWRGGARIAWTQLRAVGLLAGLVVLIYAEYEVLTAGGTSGREKAAQAILVVLLLPNLMIGGALTGFGVTLFDGLTFGPASMFDVKVGLFGNSRPWLIYVLIAAAVVGTLLPWFLVRTRRRVVNPAAFGPAQVWRAAVFGALAGVAAAMLGELSVSGSSGVGTFGVPTEIGLSYSLLGAVVAGALWCAAAYLALAFLVTPRATHAVAGASQPAGSSYAHSWPGAGTHTIPQQAHSGQPPEQGHPQPAPMVPAPSTQPAPDAPVPERPADGSATAEPA